jgi:hypothetical protein
MITLGGAVRGNTSSGEYSFYSLRIDPRQRGKIVVCIDSRSINDDSVDRYTRGYINILIYLNIYIYVYIRICISIHTFVYI